MKQKTELCLTIILRFEGSFLKGAVEGGVGSIWPPLHISISRRTDLISI